MGRSIGAVMRRKRAAREKQEDRLTEDLLHHAVLRDAVYDAAMALYRTRETLQKMPLTHPEKKQRFVLETHAMCLTELMDACRAADEAGI